MAGFYAHMVDEGRYEYGIIRDVYQTIYTNPYAALRGGTEWIGRVVDQQYERCGEAPDMTAAISFAEAAASALS